MAHHTRVLTSMLAGLAGFLWFWSNGHHFGEVRRALGQYTVKQFALHYIPQSANSLSLSGSNQAMMVDIGFQFTYFGTQYSQVSISTNGLLCFGGSSPNSGQGHANVIVANMSGVLG